MSLLNPHPNDMLTVDSLDNLREMTTITYTQSPAEYNAPFSYLNLNINLLRRQEVAET